MRTLGGVWHIDNRNHINLANVNTFRCKLKIPLLLIWILDFIRHSYISDRSKTVDLPTLNLLSTFIIYKKDSDEESNPKRSYVWLFFSQLQKSSMLLHSINIELSPLFMKETQICNVLFSSSK